MARPGIDEHAPAPPALDQPLVYKLLIALQDREWIDPIFGCYVAHRWQRIAFLEHSLEDHRDHPVPKLAINRLTVVPLTVHPVFQITLASYSCIIFEVGPFIPTVVSWCAAGQ